MKKKCSNLIALCHFFGLRIFLYIFEDSIITENLLSDSAQIWRISLFTYWAVDAANGCENLFLWRFQTLKICHISSRLSKFPFSQQIYSPVRSNLATEAVNCFKISQFWKFYDILELRKNVIFPLNSQNFHIHSEVIVGFSLILAFEFV